MKTEEILTTSNIIRSIDYTIKQSSKIHKDIAVLYLTVLYRANKESEVLVPLPIWFFGLKNWKDYISFFNRMNLIFKSGNSYSTSNFLVGTEEVYQIQDPITVGILLEEVAELHDHLI